MLSRRRSGAPSPTSREGEGVGGSGGWSRSVLSLPFPWALALRYLRSARREAFTRFLSAVATGGIALGVAALVLALAALSGLQQALRQEILARTPEIEIELPAGADAAAIEARVAAQPGVAGVQRLLRGRGWLLSDRRAQAVEIFGYEGRVPPFFAGAAGGPAGLYLGDTLARRWGLVTGQPLDLVAPRPMLTPLGPQPRLRSLPLAGTFRTGKTEQELRVAAPWSVAATLLGGARPLLAIAVGDLDRALEVARQLSTALPAGSAVRTWRDLNRPLFFALRLEKSLMFVGVFLIVLVAGLALLSDLALVLASKRREVGALGAMGADGRALGRAFLLLGGLLAGFGVLVGAGVGATAALVLDRWRLVSLPTDVYFIDYLPFVVRPSDLAAVVGLTLLLALAFSALAARRAAALSPVEALRA